MRCVQFHDCRWVIQDDPNMSSVAFLLEAQKGKCGLIHDQVIESALRCAPPREYWPERQCPTRTQEAGDSTATVSPTIAGRGQRTSELAEP